MSGAMEEKLAALLDAAEERGGCLATTEHSLVNALRRRERRGEVVNPVRGLWVRSAFWASLDPPARIFAQIRGLHDAFPVWVFAGASAAVACGYSVGWRSLDHVTIATARGGQRLLDGAVRTLRAPPGDAVMASGVPVTPTAQTVFDCARTLGLREGLAVADSALAARDVGRRELAEFVQAKGGRWRGARDAELVARLADGRAGSGGESVARAAMYELGFRMPELQEEVVDPVSGASFYVDFCWRLEDGRMVFGELDGGEKYFDAGMTEGRGGRWAMRRERIRESRLTAVGGAVMRFSPADVEDSAGFARLLDGFGIPREREPLIQVPAPPEYPDEEPVPIEAYWFD